MGPTQSCFGPSRERVSILLRGAGPRGPPLPRGLAPGRGSNLSGRPLLRPPPPPGHQTMRLPLLPSSHLPHAPNLPHAAGSLFGIVTKVKLQLYEAPTYSGAMVWKDDPEHVNYK